MNKRGKKTMSTNAIVALKLEDGNVGYNFITYDGYFEGAGLDIVKYANNRESAEILVKHMGCVNNVITGLTDRSDATLFCLNSVDSIDSLIKRAVESNIQYIYYFKDGHWYGRKTGECSFRLDSLLTEHENSQEFRDKFISFEKGKLRIDSEMLKSEIINKINNFDSNSSKSKNETVDFFLKIANFFEEFIKC